MDNLFRLPTAIMKKSVDLCIMFISACKMNVHKRCEKNVANNCGINTRDMADILKELGISGDKLSKPKKVPYLKMDSNCIVLFC